MYGHLRDEALALELIEREKLTRNGAGTSDGATEVKRVSTSLLEDDAVIRAASTLNVCAESTFCRLFADDDEALAALLRALLGQSVESLRVLLASPPVDSEPVSSARGPTLFCRCELRNGNGRGEIVLVLLRASSLLVPSRAVLTVLRDELLVCDLLNRHRSLLNSVSNGGPLASLLPIASHPRFDALLGFDRAVSLVLVKEHVDGAFASFNSARLTGISNPAASAHGPLASCVFTINSDQLEARLPWSAVEQRFLSLRVFRDEFTDDGMVSKRHEAVREQPELWQWLFFLSQQSRITSLGGVPPFVRENVLLWRVWRRAAEIARGEGEASE